MKDFNFFEPYRKKKATTNLINLIVILVLFGGIGGLALLSGLEYIVYLNNKKQIESINMQLQDPNFQKKLKEVDEVTVNLADVKVRLASMEDIDLVNLSSSIINENTISLITNNLTDNLNLDNLSISGTNVSFTGSGLDKAVIGRFESNLRRSGDFSGIFVSETHLISTGEPEEWKKYLGYIPPQFSMSMQLVQHYPPELLESVRQRNPNNVKNTKVPDQSASERAQEAPPQEVVPKEGTQ